MKVVYESHEPDKLAYACEKLGVAVWKLATGIEEIKARLADAYTELAILQESDFPLELADLYKGICYKLTCGKMQYDTAIKNGKLVRVPAGRLYSTLRYMRKDKAQEIGRQIYELKEKL